MNKIVIGMGFGDEGKGLFTDYLCSHSLYPLVVRFSGGHQVSHTVVTDKVHHVFSNFGSGTLRGVPTYWSKFCTIEPIGLLNELEDLKLKGITPKLFIDEKCPITTPCEIFYNRKKEHSNKHGSCGVGFGTTIEREEKHYSLSFGDLFYPQIFKEKLRIIVEKYYNFDFEDKSIIEEFIKKCFELTNIQEIEKTNGLPLKFYENYIFEGSQGLLLDQNFGFFPNVTRSNTGLKNAYIIQKQYFHYVVKDYQQQVYLVTRAYQTRHGNGFMTNENIPHNIMKNHLETNVDNQYQGKFRKSLLDVSLLEYAINKDEHIKNLSSQQKNLVITCLDHIENEYRFTYKEKIINCLDEKEFINKVANILKIGKIYISKNENSKNIIQFK